MEGGGKNLVGVKGIMDPLIGVTEIRQQPLMEVIKISSGQTCQ